MSKKVTQKSSPSFSKVVESSLYELFHPCSKSSLIDYNQLDFIDFSQLSFVDFHYLKGFVDWKQLKLMDLAAFMFFVRYVGAMSITLLVFGFVFAVGSVTYGGVVDALDTYSPYPPYPPYAPSVQGVSTESTEYTQQVVIPSAPACSFTVNGGVYSNKALYFPADPFLPVEICVSFTSSADYSVWNSSLNSLNSYAYSAQADCAVIDRPYEMEILEVAVFNYQSEFLGSCSIDFTY